MTDKTELWYPGKDDKKVTLNNNLEVAKLTIDCEDPMFANNANCLTYTYGDGDKYKSTDSGS